MLQDNNKLASFILTGLPKVLKGVPQIEVTFDIDSNGILQVTAVENSTGREATVTVVNDKSRREQLVLIVDHLKPEEIARMIEEAEVYQVQDEEKQSSMKQKADLETYLYSVTKVLKKSDVKKNMPKDLSEKLFDEVEEILEWCEENPEEKPDVYEKKLRDFELKTELIISPFRVFDGRIDQRL